MFNIPYWVLEEGSVMFNIPYWVLEEGSVMLTYLIGYLRKGV